MFTLNFDRKSKPIKNPTLEYTTPNAEQRDLMRKLTDDIVKVLGRHFELCAPIHNPYQTYTMQINVLMKIVVYYFTARYNNTDQLIPFMDMYLKQYYQVQK